MEKLSDVAAKATNVSPVNLGSLGITQQQFDAMPSAAKTALAKAAQAVRDAEAKASKAGPVRDPAVKLSDKGYFVVTGLPENPVTTFSPKGLEVVLNGFGDTLRTALAEHGEAQQAKLDAYRLSPERATVVAAIKAERAARKEASK